MIVIITPDGQRHVARDQGWAGPQPNTVTCRHLYPYADTSRMAAMNFYAASENPENPAESLRDFTGTREQALAWARNETNEGYVCYVFDGNDRMLDRRLWETNGGD